MLELWPTTPQPSHTTQRHHQQNDKNSYSRYPNDRDSISTLVDFGNWISQQSHSRSSSLLPPTPKFLRQNIFTSTSDSVECPLSSTAQGRYVSHSAEEQENALLGRSTRPDQLETLRLELQHSSFSSNKTRGQTARTITPVPSLTYSQHSTVSSLAAEGDFPEIPVSIFPSTTPESSPADRRPSMNHMAPEHLKHKADSTRHDHGPWSNITTVTNMMLYRDEILGHEFAETDPNQGSAHAQAQISQYPLRPVPNPNFVEPQLQSRIAQPQIPRSENEVSYIDWDDDDEEERPRRSESRLARMKKSITDLRAAERFIADAATRRNTSFKPGKCADPVDFTPASRFDKARRPAYHRVVTDNTLLSLHRKQQQNRQRAAVARAVSADKVFKKGDIEPEDPKPSTSISQSLPSKLGSVRILAPARLRNQFGTKFSSGPHNDPPQHQQQQERTSSQSRTPATPSLLPSPTLSIDLPQHREQETSPKRHRRGRTVSSGLEGFPQLATTTRPSHPHPHGLLTLTATPPTLSLLSAAKPVKKRKRFSTFASLSGPKTEDAAVAVGASRGDHTTNTANSKRPKLGHSVVTRWVRRVFGGGDGCGKGRGKGKEKGKNRGS